MPEWKHRRATGGGVLLDLASHHFDLVRWLLEDELNVTHASVTSQRSELDHAVVELVSAKGVFVQGLYSFRALARRSARAVRRGRYAHDRSSSRHCHHHGEATRWLRRSARADRAVGDLLQLQAMRWAGRELNPSYRRALGAFVEYAGGGSLRGASLEDGRRSLDLVLAAEAYACASSSERLDRQSRRR
jgi:predicted dehydrogenase